MSVGRINMVMMKYSRFPGGMEHHRWTNTDMDSIEASVRESNRTKKNTVHD